MAEDVIDDVNSLLKLGVGDLYRLEHIKQSYMANKTVWESDRRYLDHMREKYLVSHAEGYDEPERPEEETVFIHCWKCGKRSPMKANFCMACGNSLFEVGQKPQEEQTAAPAPPRRKRRKLKIIIIIIIPLLFLSLAAGAASQGYLDSITDRIGSGGDDAATPEPEQPEVKPPAVEKPSGHSKCGAGTIFDQDTNTCVLG